MYKHYRYFSSELINKVLFVITLFALGCLRLNAQIPIGFKAGLNLNQLVLRDLPPHMGEEHKSYVTSFHVGVYTKVKLSNSIDFIPELQFVEKESLLNSYNGLKIKLRYLDMPLIFSYRPIKWINVEGGGSIGFNIDNDGYYENYKSIDAGILGGLRFNLTRKLSLLSRYYYGLTPIQKFPPALGPEIKAYNENLFFSVSYYLK